MLLDLEELDDGRFLRLADPPSAIVADSLFEPCAISRNAKRQITKRRAIVDIHSRNAAAKLIHTFPSQVRRPVLLTMPGILAVSSSSRRWTTPCGSRKPTMILGTPSRNDWAQNLRSFLSYLSMSRSERSSAEVFSSTQWMGSSFRSGLQSQTVWSVCFGIQIDGLGTAYRHRPRLQ